MEDKSEVERLIRHRDELRAEIAQIGDMRPGSLIPRFRKCGKPSCHCASEGSRGHGPSWSLTREVNGKTVTKIIPSEAAVESTKQQMSEFKRFRELTRELTEVSDKLCDAKLKAEADATAKKGASKAGSKRKS